MLEKGTSPHPIPAPPSRIPRPLALGGGPPWVCPKSPPAENARVISAHLPLPPSPGLWVRSSSTFRGSPPQLPRGPDTHPGDTYCPRTPLQGSTTRGSRQTGGGTRSCTPAPGSKSPPGPAGRRPGLPPSPTPPSHPPGWARGASVWVGFGGHKATAGPDLCLEGTKQFWKVCPQCPPNR